MQKNTRIVRLDKTVVDALVQRKQQVGDTYSSILKKVLKIEK